MKLLVGALLAAGALFGLQTSAQALEMSPTACGTGTSGYVNTPVHGIAVRANCDTNSVAGVSFYHLPHFSTISVDITALRNLEIEDADGIFLCLKSACQKDVGIVHNHFFINSIDAKFVPINKNTFRLIWNFADTQTFPNNPILGCTVTSLNLGMYEDDEDTSVGAVFSRILIDGHPPTALPIATNHNICQCGPFFCVPD